MALAGLPAAADAASCAKAAKPSAGDLSLAVRKLQTRLMVAALTCGARNEYNSFVSRYQPELVRHGRAMQRHFRKTYGAASTKHLNRYVTELANEASARSIADRANFCADSDVLFARLRVKAEALDSFVMHGAALNQEDRCTELTSSTRRKAG